MNADARPSNLAFRGPPSNMTFLVSAVNSAWSGPQGIARVIVREGNIHGNMLSIFVEGSDPAVSGKGSIGKVGSVPTA